MDPRGKLVLLPPNRVWRTYQGGQNLDRLAAAAAPADSHFPEDWVASTTRAVNPGREAIPEGRSTVRVGGELHDFAPLLATDPAYFLGADHAAAHGASPHLLVKLLDPSIRLHFQVHPTAAFARRFLNSPSGKTEAYHVLATRPEVAAPYIYLGFQRPPGRATLRRLIETQDLAALEACFDRIPVQPGDTFLVPGGVPHALGEGILLVEVQEPSDLVVRFEFERGGYVLPESARFMGRGLDFCLDVFDPAPWPLHRVQTEAVCPPRRRRALGPDSHQDDLIGPERTPCFRMRHSHYRGPATKIEPAAHIGIVTAGACTVQVGGETHHLGLYDKFFAPAGLGPLAITPGPVASILECYPPDAPAPGQPVA
ncbi:putative mannose-6-phosphate isomerase GmuF [Lacunisphaera limnophila]|uniref:Putative mannose-6-phosphate isomerase GmuF n=1 Tax=Lacunisphaera limnophila TaxID=1838286 RepID=A0A1D8ATH5_9BACT|nr:class I mannose-6-phosphate isomerase [Lacunisphaera limnophila]AOS44204.1 putative mannose-6-phosphate isomerase GmuF [Lacunisphaera limnophila]